jgi:hypothetical protein
MNPDERTDLDQQSDAGAYEIARLPDEPQVRALDGAATRSVHGQAADLAARKESFGREEG